MNRCGLELIHPGEMSRAGFIMDQIETSILTADVVLAILTGKNPNVAHEVALALGARKSVIILCRSRDDVYFDVRHLRYWTYGGSGELETLGQRLEEAIHQSLAEQTHRSTSRKVARRDSGLLVDAVTAFIGPTLRGPLQPKLVTSWKEYEAFYGQPLTTSESFLGYAIRGFFENGGAKAWVTRIVCPDASIARVDIHTLASTQTLLAEASSIGAWGNSVGLRIRPGTRTGIRLSVTNHEVVPTGPNVEAAYEDYDNLGFAPNQANYIVDRVNSRSRLVRLSWLSPTVGPACPVDTDLMLAGGSDGGLNLVDAYLGSESVESGRSGLRAVEMIEDVAIVCVPDHVHPTLSADDRQRISDAVVSHCERARDRIAILATPEEAHSSVDLKPKWDSEFAAIYYPWIRVFTAEAADGGLIPAIGHLAGLFERNDVVRGVHFAPLDLCLNGSVRDRDATAAPLARDLTPQQRDEFRRLGINPIHIDFKEQRPTVTSALTVAVEEGRQALNARLLCNYIARSIHNSTQWTAYERNSEDLWHRVTKCIGDFLNGLWEAEALVGERAEEAFFVKCDRTTMTKDDIDNRRLIIMLGIAPFMADSRVELDTVQLRAGLEGWGEPEQQT